MSAQGAGVHGDRGGWAIDRPRLAGFFGPSSPRRLTVLSAGAGFGKTSLAREWVAGQPAVWLALTESDRDADNLARHLVDAIVGSGIAAADRPPDLLLAATREGAAQDTERADAVARLIAGAFDPRPGSPVMPSRGEFVLVLDDLHELSGGSAEGLVAALVRQLPSVIRVLVTTRTSLPFPNQRLRAHGDVAELTARDLAFDLSELESVVDASLGSGGRELAGPLRRVTGGWPAAVRLLLETIRLVPASDRVAALDAPGQGKHALFPYLAEEVFARESVDVIELIRVLAPHPEIDSELCAALGLPEAEASLADLERRGLFVARSDQLGFFTLHRLIRDYADQHLPLTADRLLEGQRAAARRYERRGDPERALRIAKAIGDGALVADLLDRHAATMLARGRADAIIEAAGSLPVADRSPDTEIALGDALAYAGRAVDALACFERASGADRAPPAAVAWRLARLYSELGDQDRAASVLEEAAPATNLSDEARCLAYAALVRFFRLGDDDAVSLAIQAASTADRSGDDGAQSVAHTAAAFALAVSDPGRSRDHHRRALEAAERAGDVVQIVRLRNAEDDLPLGEQFELATDSLARIEAAGNPSWLGRTLLSRGLIALDLGRYEVAAADLERARQVSARTGPTAELMPVAVLAELGRIRGDIAQATIGFRRVVEGADAVGDTYLSAYARAGLARLLARTEPDESRQLVEIALADGGIHRGDYLVAAAWVAACQDRPSDARDYAREAISAAGSSPGRAAALASAMEVDGLIADDPGKRMARLREAAGIWERLGNQAAASATRLAIAIFADGQGSRATSRARRHLESAGIRAAAADGAGLLALLPPPSATPLAIRVLGGFAVLRDGSPIAAGEWKSRKARDVLKFLVTRRGVPATRDELAELLWPDEPFDILSNRLSVALSMVRTVLDPAHEHPADHYVTTDRQAVALRTDQLSIDVDDFVADARAGLDQLARGARDEAEELLSTAEGRYAGDLLPEDMFADWAVHAREQARGLYLQVTRALADLAVDRGDADGAVRLLMRAIDIDPYDEPAHLGLIRVLASERRHGEARRAYQLYTTRLAELEIEPVPYPPRADGHAPTPD